MDPRFGAPNIHYVQQRGHEVPPPVAAITNSGSRLSRPCNRVSTIRQWAQRWPRVTLTGQGEIERIGSSTGITVQDIGTEVRHRPLGRLQLRRLYDAGPHVSRGLCFKSRPPPAVALGIALTAGQGFRTLNLL